MQKLKPLRKMFLVSICLTLLGTPTKAQNLDTIVEKGAPAPFGGVLVPEDHYRFYQEKRQIADVLSSKKIELPVVDPKLAAEAFFGGALVGALSLTIFYLVFAHK